VLRDDTLRSTAFYISRRSLPSQCQHRVKSLDGRACRLDLLARVACLVRRQARAGGEALGEQRESAHGFRQCAARVEQGGDFRRRRE
jgi:hypothetical protein